MKKISEIFNVEILDDEYNNSNDFTYEKQVDQMRYIYNNLSLKYLFYKDYSKYFAFEMPKNLTYARKVATDDKFKKQYGQFLNNNLKKIKIKLTKNSKTPKSKVFEDFRLTDYFIDFCDMHKQLGEYNNLLKKYTRAEFGEISNISIFDEKSGQNYDICFNPTGQLTNLSYYCLKVYPEDKKVHEACKQWLELLKQHAKIVTWNYEYSITVDEIENITPYTEEETKVMKQINNVLTNKCKMYLQNKTKEDNNEKIL